VVEGSLRPPDEGAYPVGTLSEEHYTLLTDYDKNGAYSEAYRTLYANMCLDGFDQQHNDHAEAPPSSQCHTLLLTTPSAYAEYATVAANLAIVAAQSGTPTILVDANLRAPHLQQRFGLPKTSGLSELLAAESITPHNAAACLQTTFVPGLRLLGAGAATEPAVTLMLSPKLAEVINSIRRLLEETEAKTSIVIFHSLPVLSGADASLIGALVERTLLTIATGHTTRTQAKQAQEQLEHAHVKLAGIIITDK
jgi:Mrp family chromosome partitioning ATPase